MSDEEWLAPFDYMTLFAPKSVEELRKISGQNPPVGADDYKGASIPKDAVEADEASIDSLL